MMISGSTESRAGHQIDGAESDDKDDNMMNQQVEYASCSIWFPVWFQCSVEPQIEGAEYDDEKMRWVRKSNMQDVRFFPWFDFQSSVEPQIEGAEYDDEQIWWVSNSNMQHLRFDSRFDFWNAIQPQVEGAENAAYGDR